MTMTRTKARTLARQARRGGYYDTGRTLWVICPLTGCNEHVTADRYTGRTVISLLDAAVVDHLLDEHPDT